MKFFAFVMSFYLLALSCYPCGDKEDYNVKAEQKISSSAQHREHRPNEETCTPFCSCSCCPASAFYTPIPKLQEARIDLQAVKYPLYKVAFNTRVSYSIWQPPKIS